MANEVGICKEGGLLTGGIPGIPGISITQQISHLVYGTFI